jgi:hypothetical protein
MDLRNSKFPPEDQPDLIFHTYLLDALGYRMIQVQDGIISEVEIQCTLPDRFHVPDTSHFPPDILSLEDIRRLLESSRIDTQRLVIERRINRIIKRHYRVVPLEKQHGIPEEEKVAIREYAAERKIKEGVFLFSMDALECTRNIARVLPSEALLVMLDYSPHTDVAKPGQYEVLLRYHLTKFGQHFYLGVSNDMMKYVLSRSCDGPRDVWRVIPDGVFLGAHSLFLFYRGEQSMALDSMLQSRFPLFLNILHRFPTELFPSNNNGRMVPYEELESWTHYSPYHLWWGSHKTWASNDSEQVAVLLDMLDEQFGGANPKTLFSRAILADRQGKSQQALEILDELVKSVPLFEEPFAERMFILSKMTDKLRLIQAIRDFISVTSLTDIDGILFELVKLYHQTDNSPMANRIISHIANHNIDITRR